MRNPDRIPYVLRELEKIWRKVPDYRLGQLMWAIAQRDPHFIEDYDTITEGARRYGVEDELEMEDFPDYYM
jgi:hypothetical protein